MASHYLDQLAEFVATVRLEDLAGSTVAAAKDVVLDTIGAVSAGSRQPENANLAQLAANISGPVERHHPWTRPQDAAGLGHAGERHRRRRPGDG